MTAITEVEHRAVNVIQVCFPKCKEFWKRKNGEIDSLNSRPYTYYITQEILRRAVAYFVSKDYLYSDKVSH